MGQRVLELGDLALQQETVDPLERLRQWAAAGLAAFQRAAVGEQAPGAVISRIRGTGPGVSFGEHVVALEAAHPITLRAPFEGARSVAGGVWDCRALLGSACTDAFLKLRFEHGSTELPMHCHPNSDRWIAVLEGRGFFHVTDEPIDRFTGVDVRTVPVRSRDVLMFKAGTVHTFSTHTEPLVLLSYHSPYVPLNSPEQYALPKRRWSGAEASTGAARVACDPAWTVLAGRSNASNSVAVGRGCAT